MSDGTNAAQGSAPAAAAAPAAATPAAAAPAAAAPAAGGDAWNGLQDAGNREYATKKGWAGVDDAIKGYREAETKLSSALFLPAADAPPEAREAFYDKLGRPKTAGEYKYQRGANVPQDFPYQESSMLALSQVAHKAGLTQEQAQSVHDGIVNLSISQFQAERQKEVTAIEAADADLVKMWGDKNGEVFKRNVELSNRAIRNLGGEPLMAELKRIGALGKDGEVKSPMLVDLLAKAGKGMFSEDTIFEGPNVANNPFAKDNEDLTEQGKIFKANPDRARNLIRAAGRQNEPAMKRLMGG